MRFVFVGFFEDFNASHRHTDRKPLLIEAHCGQPIKDSQLAAREPQLLLLMQKDARVPVSFVFVSICLSGKCRQANEDRQTPAEERFGRLG